MDLWLDSATPAGSARSRALDQLEHMLTLPLDPAERAHVEDQEWGLSPDAIAESQRLDSMFG